MSETYLQPNMDPFFQETQKKTILSNYNMCLAPAKEPSNLLEIFLQNFSLNSIHT